MKTEANESVYGKTIELFNCETGESENRPYGLTKREHFAAMSMQAFLSNPEDYKLIDAAQMATICADLLISQLNAEVKND
jgi:hypothetical protein